MSPTLQTSLGQEDFSSGMVRDIAPELIPDSGVYDLVNGLLDEDSSPYRRGGTAYLSQKKPSAFPVLDNFNRADESPVSQGGNWVGPMEEGFGNLKVVSNQLAGTFGTGSAVYNKTVSDGAVYVTPTQLGLVTILGIRTAEENSKKLRGYFFSFSAGTASLFRRNGDGTYQQLDYSERVRYDDGDSFALMAIGEEISAWHQRAGGEWRKVFTGSDSAWTSGRLGISGALAGPYDNFGGGEVTPFTTSGLTWNWEGYLLPGARSLLASTNDFGVLAEDDEGIINLGGAGLNTPMQSAVLEDLLFIGGGFIYGGSRKTASYTAGTIGVEKGTKAVKGSSTAFLANIDAGMLLHIGSERVYVVASVNSDTELTLRDNYEGTSGTGKAYSLSPLYTVGSDPYENWDYVTVCANRLVLMSGSKVKYTEVDNPHTFTNWLNTTNEHDLPDGVDGSGLATIGSTVLCFTTGGIQVLDGLALDIVDQNGNTQHRMQPLSSDIILAGATGIAGSGQELVIPAEDGVYLMDGISQPTRISRPIERYYRQRIAAGYKLGKAEVFRGHYFLPIITASSEVRSLLVCRLDRSTRSRRQTFYPWGRFTGDGGEIPSFAVRNSADPVEPLLLGAQGRSSSQIVDCSHYFEPDAEHATDADGSVHNLEIVTRAYQTGSGTINRVRTLKPRYELTGAKGRLQASYSDGSAKGGGAKFGTAVFGKDKFGGEMGGANFIPIGEAGESDGRDPARFRVNKKFRFIRLRIKSDGPLAYMAVRDLELTIRPSGATRR